MDRPPFPPRFRRPKARVRAVARNPIEGEEGIGIDLVALTLAIWLGLMVAAAATRAYIATHLPPPDAAPARAPGMMVYYPG